MSNHLEWPFFEPAHRALAREASAWLESGLAPIYALDNTDAQCRALVAAMGNAGFLRRAIATRDGEV